jgi:hypothetical protein
MIVNRNDFIFEVIFRKELRRLMPYPLGHRGLIITHEMIKINANYRQNKKPTETLLVL